MNLLKLEKKTKLRTKFNFILHDVLIVVFGSKGLFFEPMGNEKHVLAACSKVLEFFGLRTQTTIKGGLGGGIFGVFLVQNLNSRLVTVDV